jgi:triosephosphate isomerase
LAQIKKQLEDGLDKLPKKAAENLIVAYEPVWAIGKGATGVETPAGFQHNALFIRKTLSLIFSPKEAMKIPILYGGSVNSKNAETFLREGSADGLLVGRDSLASSSFVEIVKIANQIK